MKRALYVANVFSHFKSFHLPYIQLLAKNGWQVDAVAGDDCNYELPGVTNIFRIDMQRNPFHLSNLRGLRQLTRIIEREGYDLVHCHTPMGGVLARLAARKRRAKGFAKVIYTAHGFHFYKGAPLINWMLYFPVEKFLSRYTDAIITINEEDLQAVSKHGFHNKRTYKIDGIGIDSKRLLVTNNNIRNELRKEYGYDDSDFILIYTAEFIRRKNHKLIIESLYGADGLVFKLPNIRILFAGRGELMEKMKQLSKLYKVDGHVEFLGYRNDIGRLIALSDIAISSSRQEGLAMNVAEAAYSGLPLVVSNVRGNRELVKEGLNGMLYTNRENFIDCIVQISESEELRERMSLQSHELAQQLTIAMIEKHMQEIYNQVLNFKF